ncbi:molybdenum ABC transporter ATP-binding protein [Nitratireductor sp. XY-223]|uniref:molybdenum ABC transporter ATP-binding protein n=1 Tax=Nitratireductor sp. XY-223 TaxID=2561926 RepID=UPI0010AA7172|nr:molybdenum ABC transporter ATP-binding protein [Nitratireductor sp. XY-223]
MSLEVRIHSRLGSFEIAAEFEAGAGVTALFGHSGSGKTSILKMIAGLVRPQSGRIMAEGRTLFDSDTGTDLAPPKRRIGMVFQDARLFPHMSVGRNLTYGRWAGNRGSGADFRRITELLGIEALLDRYPATLSGGEMQRVAIGRALLADPALLLMDEPLASLDQERKREILPYLEEVRDEMGLPIVYVSHEVDEVARLADTLVLLSDGKVLGSGDAVEMFSKLEFGPALGRHEASSLLSGTISGIDAQYGLCEISLSEENRLFLVSERAQVGDRLRMRVKARDVALSLKAPEGVSVRNVLPATVRDFARDESPFVEIVLDVGGQALRARITRHAFDALGIRPGLPVFAMIKSVAIGQRMLSGRR